MNRAHMALILACERASVADPEIVALCGTIARTKRVAETERWPA